MQPDLITEVTCYNYSFILGSAEKLVQTPVPRNTADEIPFIPRYRHSLTFTHLKFRPIDPADRLATPKGVADIKQLLTDLAQNNTI